MDVSNSENVENVFLEIAKKYKTLDILVNNAGINGFEGRQDLLDERIKLTISKVKNLQQMKKLKAILM